MMLTVFTPAYNRADYLQRVYDSLLRQTCRDFEWLIIDDGSSDHTSAVVSAFVQEGKLPVRYYQKENGGKHTAYNLALTKAEGDWFVCVDADDYLQDGAVEHIRTATAAAEGDGIVAYKADHTGKLLSKSFPAELTRCKFSDLTLRLGCSGEFTLIYPTRLLKQYPFPVFSGERFVGETVIYDRLDRVCNVRPLGQVITVCEYLQDGYSRNFDKLLKNNPSGFCLYFMQRIDLQPSFGGRLIHGGKYWCFRWISKNKTLRYAGRHKALVALAVIPGMVFRVYYKLLRKI